MSEKSTFFILEIEFDCGKLYVPANGLDKILKQLDKELENKERRRFVKKIVIRRATKKDMTVMYRSWLMGGE